MNSLYFKDANGEFHPIKVSQLDLMPNQLVFIQFVENDKKRVSHQDMEGLISILDAVVDTELQNVEFVILTNEIKIEVLNKDTELKNKEMLIDISALGSDKDKEFVKGVLNDSLKRFNHEFVRLPIKIKGGNA